MQKTNNREGRAPQSPERKPGGSPRIRSDSLFARGDEVIIEHCGEQYRLRRTRAGKLILTK